VGHHTEAYVGIDTSKSCNAIAIADGGRDLMFSMKQGRQDMGSTDCSRASAASA
jgi:hypothetical protein